MRRAGEYQLLTVEEEQDLAKRIIKGDKIALDKMVCANLRLVVKIAGDFIHTGVDLMDLISAGNGGLQTAAERFRSGEAKFSTYAAWWIKQSIRRHIANHRNQIRLPVHAADKAIVLRRLAKEWDSTHDKPATPSDLSGLSGIPVEKVVTILTPLNCHSLDAPLDDGVSNSSSTVGDVTADDAAVVADTACDQANLTSKLDQLISELPARDGEIIRLRFGLTGHDMMTLEELGRRFNLTRERIRQLQDKSLRHLRQCLDKQLRPCTPGEIAGAKRADIRGRMLIEFIAHLKELKAHPRPSPTPPPMKTVETVNHHVVPGHIYWNDAEIKALVAEVLSQRLQDLFASTAEILHRAQEVLPPTRRRSLSGMTTTGREFQQEFKIQLEALQALINEVRTRKATPEVSVPPTTQQKTELPIIDGVLVSPRLVRAALNQSTPGELVDALLPKLKAVFR